MRGGAGRVAAPDKNKLALEHHFGRRSQPPANRQDDGLLSRGSTDGTLQATRPQPVPEPAMRDRAIHQPQRTRVAIREYTLRPVLLNQSAPSTRNLGNGLIPGDTLEYAAPFRPGAAQRIAQTVRMIHAVQVAVHFRAQ